MVEESVRDGRRIAELVSSELSGRSDGVLAAVAVVNADRDVTPSADGAKAYEIAVEDTVLGSVFVHETRARIDLDEGLEAARAVAEGEDIRVRGRGDPPGLYVFVEDGAAVKRAVTVVRAACEAVVSTSSNE